MRKTFTAVSAAALLIALTSGCMGMNDGYNDGRTGAASSDSMGSSGTKPRGANETAPSKGSPTAR